MAVECVAWVLGGWRLGEGSAALAAPTGVAMANASVASAMPVVVRTVPPFRTSLAASVVSQGNGARSGVNSRLVAEIPVTLGSGKRSYSAMHTQR
ncbi:MAG: hypothetical protein ACOYD0_05150 [Candidatus Nanopelagicales bacterium]